VSPGWLSGKLVQGVDVAAVATSAGGSSFTVLLATAVEVAGHGRCLCWWAASTVLVLVPVVVEVGGTMRGCGQMLL